MATDETDGLVDENRDEGGERAEPISEGTVRTEHLSLAELRCGITLGGDAEPDQPPLSSTDEPSTTVDEPVD